MTERKEPITLTAEGGALGIAVASATARLRTNMAVPHLLAAATHARNARDVEAENRGQPWGDFWEDIRSHSIATILCAVAGIESFANELFADRRENFPKQPDALLAAFWPVYERLPVMQKLNFALGLRDKQALDLGRSPAQTANLLIELRNAITHFKPEWDDEEEGHARLSKKLDGILSPSPWLRGERLFPRAWVSSSTCAWAVNTAVALLRDFEVRAGLERSKFEGFDAKLTV